ncbi:MAG: proline racemase family protein [Trueperaceae bacterium]
MEYVRTYTTVDAHAAGEPLRIVTAGVPRLVGDDMLAKRRWMRERLDHVRRELLWEPRGHADMYGAVLTEPVSDSADFGTVFFHNEGYSDMCGHGILALATVVVQQGLVSRAAPETRVGFDTPAGFVEAFVAWDGRRCGEARFVNVPSFLYARDVTVPVEGFGDVTVDVAFGGAFYAYLDADDLGLTVTPGRAAELTKAADRVSRAVRAALPIRHPTVPELHDLYGTVLTGPPSDAANDQANVCVFAEREVDRSPTGTATAGRLAQLVARGRWPLGRPLRNESLIGSVFVGRALRETTVGDLDAIVPEIAGRAHVTGFSQWVVEADDAIGRGFLVR